MTLKEITRGLLYEGVSNDDINHAIDGHKYVVINYEGTDGTHNGKRMIQPVAFGCTTAGHPVIRAYENFGDTKTAVPRWKFLRVDRISSWRETDKTFDEPAELFNPYDDKTMSIVYNIAKFGDEEDELSSTPNSSPKKKSDEKPQIYRTETERKLERLRKQLKNPLTLSDFKTQNAFDNTNLGDTQKSGPKRNKDKKKDSDDVYTDEYNYNVFDNSLDAAGKRTKRNGHYYFQNRKNGKFVKGNLLDEPQTDDEKEIEDYLNKDNGNSKAIEDLRKLIGDTSKPISLRDLQDRLKRK